MAVWLPRSDEMVHDFEVAEDKTRRHLREVGILVKPLVTKFRITIEDKKRGGAYDK